ncbi:MAG: transmembrane 220 family protein [Candidatus Hydrogenedentes bacterium]|nr:transmembrane 220 family protein [Candidatus Hydrogenedentota bacterium]
MAIPKKRITPFRMLSVFMLLPLGYSIFVQQNDPDGGVWMLIYGYAILMTLPAIGGEFSPWTIPGMLGYFGGFLYLLPTFESPYLKSELTREGGGLFIAAVWMLCLVVAWYRGREIQGQEITVGGCGSGNCGCGAVNP